MKVVILAGGYGTRISEETDIKPKPMIEIGGKPIIWHIMKHYAHYGFDEFIIALGYKGEYIKKYFLDYHNIAGNITLNLLSGNTEIRHNQIESWKIHLIDTGLNTLTGGRIRRLENLISTEKFMLTYGDGVSNVNLHDLMEFHNKCKTLATVTAVRPPSRFGGLIFDNELITEFTEKSQIGEGWINGGFMVLEPTVFEYLKSDKDILEIDVLEKLANEKKLSGYSHTGFWQCMDTLRDKHLLQKLWDNNNAPWKVWE